MNNRKARNALQILLENEYSSEFTIGSKRADFADRESMAVAVG